ncbi:23S rRNA (guanosine(2251)-2'-O)-methyltransferase RlmB [Clostridia bacterium]|nr:23S rRNA (guanosine(2251)-2'-O)-methyltransferase RlmB [Clostridia bacterium]
MIIEGRHAVKEALSAGHPIDKLYLMAGVRELGVFKGMAREQGVTFIECDRVRLDALSRDANDGQVGAHQGVVAVAAAHAYAEVEDIWKRAEAAGQEPFIVVCDGVEDPRNLGAIIRTAECAGAHGVIIPKRRGAGLTTSCAKAAAGALEILPVARVPGIPSFLEECKKRNVWVYGADASSEAKSVYDTDFSGGAALVLGGEGGGLSQLSKTRADALVRVPMSGKTPSLNVSAAAAILLFEAAKSRS